MSQAKHQKEKLVPVKKVNSPAVQIKFVAVFQIRIRKFLGLPDPESSIKKQKME